MKRRTEGEIKAYVDGYNACYNQFCECLKGRKSVWQAVKKMELFVTAVNSTVEVADTPQTDYPCNTCANKGDHDGECQNCVADSAPIRWETPSHYKPKQTDCPWK